MIKIFLYVLFFFSTTSFAANQSRVIGHFGLGQSSTTSASGSSVYTEAPMAFGFSFDYSFRDPYYISAEHLRTFGDGGTSVGLTGVGVKYYPWLSPRFQHTGNLLTNDKAKMSIKGNSYYFGGAAGMAQASVPPKGNYTAAVAVGIYVDAKAGIEMGISQNWTGIGEFDFATTLFGSGAIQYYNLTFGLAYSL